MLIPIPLKYSFLKGANKPRLEDTIVKSSALLNHVLFEKDRKAGSSFSILSQSQEASNRFMFYWIQTDTAEMIGATLVLKPVTEKKHTLSF